jgi:hypothetical protein
MSSSDAKLLFPIKLGKILLLAFSFAAGLIISRVLFYTLGFAAPRLPGQASESVAVYYLFIGSLILITGLYPLFIRLSGTKSIRVIITFLFIFLGFAVSVTIESSIYSDVPGYSAMMLILFLPSLLAAMVFTVLHKTDDHSVSFAKRLRTFLGHRTIAQWTSKIITVILAFPVVYFLFGIIVSPFVTEYYETEISGLALPLPGLIFLVQLLRSLIFLLITIPIVLYWNSSKRSLIFSLALAHFVMVFAYDIVLAIEMPVELVIIHGIEILGDSLVYSWIFVRLIVPGKYFESDFTSA